MGVERSKETVLLVEDNPDNRAIYATILRHSGYQVAEAATGEEALESAREAVPDLVLLDISLPGIDGWTVSERLRADPGTQNTVIVALTAHALPEDYRRAEDLGFDGFLAKPLRPREVLDEVSRLLLQKS